MSFILSVPFCIPLVLFERADAFLVSVNYIINRFYLKKTNSEHLRKERMIIIKNNNLSERRHDIFKDMLQNIFTRADLKYEYLESEKAWKVCIGDGGDLVSDCKRSYSSEYKKRFTEIFRICLLEQDVQFLCIHNKEKVEFSRDNIIDNSLDYLRKLGIIICDPFKVDSEKALFNKLIYRFILSLLDVIFDVSDRSPVKQNKDAADDDISSSFEKKISVLKRQSEKKDFTSLIYSVANKADIGVIFDPDYDRDECNYAICISVYDRAFYAINSMDLITDVRYIEAEPNERWYSPDGYYEKNDNVSFTFRDWSKEDSQGYRQTWKYMIKGFDKYPFKSNAAFKPPQLCSDIKSFKLLNYDAFNYQLPRYFYFVTKLSEKELEAKYKYVYDNPALIRCIEAKGLCLLREKYSFNEKMYSDILLDNIVNYLEGLEKIDTSDFFNTEIKVKEYIQKLPDCFINVNTVFQYFKSHKADDKQAIIIFIYSVSVLIDNFCDCISNLIAAEGTPTEDESTYSFSCKNLIMIRKNLSEEVIAECAKKVKDFLDSQILVELIDEYRAYYNEHKESLNKLSNIIENTNHRSLYALLDAPCGGENKGYYPFEYLKRSLEILHELLTARIEGKAE